MVASPAERSTLGLGNHGALKVGTVLPGLPAAEAGLKEGDFVVAVKSAPLDSVPNDRLMEKAFAAAGPVAFSVRRGAEALNLTALGKRSDSAP
jgi:S1-C subfamily serine protease